MSRLGWHFPCCRPSVGALLAWIVFGQMPGAASADALLPHKPLFVLDLTWTMAPLPAAPTSAGTPEPPPLLRFDGLPDPLLAPDAPSPGLQFTFNPDNAAVFLGWRVEF